MIHCHRNETKARPDPPGTYIKTCLQSPEKRAGWQWIHRGHRGHLPSFGSQPMMPPLMPLLPCPDRRRVWGSAASWTLRDLGGSVGPLDPHFYLHAMDAKLRELEECGAVFEVWRYGGELWEEKTNGLVLNVELHRLRRCVHPISQSLTWNLEKHSRTRACRRSETTRGLDVLCRSTVNPS